MDITGIINDAAVRLEKHALTEPGEYAQFTKGEGAGRPGMPATVYGCAIAANLLYTMNRMPKDQKIREKTISALQSFQDPNTGLFKSEGMYETHTTAFASGALELFDAEPLYRAEGLKRVLTKEGLYRFLDQEIDWSRQPWAGAHLGSGIYGSIILTRTAGPEWEDWYFSWMNENADPETGLWKKGCLSGAPLFHYLAGTFHYVFNYEYAKRELPYPVQLLDTCIRAYREGACIDFSKKLGWDDIDFSYLLARVQRRAGVRFEETQEILREIADGLTKQLLAMEPDTDSSLDNTNTLFAVMCALAVLQDALPGYLNSEKPLRLVIDRRPFL